MSAKHTSANGETNMSTMFATIICACRSAENAAREARRRVALAAVVQITPALGRPPTVAQAVAFVTGAKSAREHENLDLYGVLSLLSKEQATVVLENLIAEGFAERIQHGRVVATATGRRLIEGPPSAPRAKEG